jgi:hypothetical protein
MAIIQKHSKYGIGREATAGTAVAPGTGFVNAAGRIPQESFITLNEGTERAIVRKFSGLLYQSERENFSSGKNPTAEGFSHNLSIPILNLLLASSHGVPGTQTVTPWEFYPPADGLVRTIGDSVAASKYTFTLWQEKIRADGAGAGDGYAHSISGCVMKDLTLTFPLSGGPVKMAWSAQGMDSNVAADEQSLPLYTDPDESSYADIDLLAQDFTFWYDDQSDATPDQFYPDGDVVVTLTPVMSVEKRGTGKPYKIAFTEFAASVSFKLPADSLPDRGQADFIANTYKHIYITNTGTYSSVPNADGEILIVIRGDIVTAPGSEGEGIIKESVEIQSRGLVAGTTPYQFQVYEDAPAAGDWTFDEE